MKKHILFLALLVITTSANAQSVKFPAVLEALSNTCKNDPIQKRIWFEYGAIYISNGAILPATCRFRDEDELTQFTKQFTKPANKLSFGDFYLQPAAKQSLNKVIQELGGYQFVARICNRKNKIPCDKTSEKIKLNDDWATRTFEESAKNWKLDTSQNTMAQNKSIEEDLAIDNKNEKPKMFGAAIPGGSQHHLGLAIDVNNTGKMLCKEKCECALNKNGWYRTVPFDPYHFTYLGYSEDTLPSKGLKQISCKDDERKKSFNYWVIDGINQDYKDKYRNARCENV